MAYKPIGSALLARFNAERILMEDDALVLLAVLANKLITLGPVRVAIGAENMLELVHRSSAFDWS